jgi:hypothetical protein
MRSPLVMFRAGGCRPPKILAFLEGGEDGDGGGFGVRPAGEVEVWNLEMGFEKKRARLKAGLYDLPDAINYGFGAFVGSGTGFIVVTDGGALMSTEVTGHM